MRAASINDILVGVGNGASLRGVGWRIIAALVCAVSVALGCATAAEAQGPADPNNVVPVDGPGLLSSSGTDYAASFETSFSPQHIQPGEGFTYTGTTVVTSGTTFSNCEDGPQGQRPFGFYKVPAGTTYFSSDSDAAGLQIDGSHDSETCEAPGSITTRTTHAVSGADTADLEPGCYQGDNWNNVFSFPGSETNNGSLSTLRVGSVDGGCDPPPECNDTFHNDLDGLVDFPEDPGCSVENDASELNAEVECDNGADDDGDSKVDWPADEGCGDASDETEGVADCNDADVIDHLYTTISGVASIGLTALPDPDFGTFDMGVQWCITPSGPAIDQANPTASLSGNWVVLGALEFFGLEPYHTPSKASIAGNRALGKSTFGLRMSAAELLANFAPASKLLKVLDRAADRYQVAKRLQGKVEATRQLRKRVKAALNRWEHRLGERLKEKIAAHPGIPATFADDVTERVTDEAKPRPDTFVKALDRQPARVIFKQFLRKFDVPLWKVNAGIRVFSDGSYSFVNDSSSPVLVDEWTHSTAD